MINYLLNANSNKIQTPTKTHLVFQQAFDVPQTPGQLAQGSVLLVVLGVGWDATTINWAGSSRVRAEAVLTDGMGTPS